MILSHCIAVVSAITLNAESTRQAHQLARFTARFRIGSLVNSSTVLTGQYFFTISSFSGCVWASGLHTSTAAAGVGWTHAPSSSFRFISAVMSHDSLMSSSHKQLVHAPWHSSMYPSPFGPDLPNLINDVSDLQKRPFGHDFDFIAFTSPGAFPGTFHGDAPFFTSFNRRPRSRIVAKGASSNFASRGKSRNRQ